MKRPPIQPHNQQPAPGSAMSDPRSQAPDQIQRQLGRLFGESLFGAWPDSQNIMAAGHRPRSGRTVRRLGLVLLLGLTAASGIWLHRRAGAPQAEQQRMHLAGEVAALLDEGDLDRLTGTLAQLLPPGQPLTVDDPHLDLIISAEAALYRYQDAAPERLARIERFLSCDSQQPARLLARLTVASRPERVGAYEAMVKLPATHALGSEYHALMAMIHEERGDANAARTSWRQSLSAGPRWLPHRYLQCAFEAHRRNPEAVARIIEHMVRVAPGSPWTLMAQQHFANRPATGAAPAGSPVARYFAEFVPICQSMVDLAAARLVLGRALDMVNDQAAFVLDAFKGLRDAKKDALAMELTSYEVWPRGNPWARGALADLQASLVDSNRAAPPASAQPGVAADSHVRQATWVARKKRPGKKTAGPDKKAGKAKPHRGRK
jgi:hypothetical protein